MRTSVRIFLLPKRGLNSRDERKGIDEAGRRHKKGREKNLHRRVKKCLGQSFLLFSRRAKLKEKKKSISFPIKDRHRNNE